LEQWPNFRALSCQPAYLISSASQCEQIALYFFACFLIIFLEKKTYILGKVIRKKIENKNASAGIEKLSKSNFIWKGIEDTIWIWGTYTNESNWFSTPHSIMVTHNGGKNWVGIPQLLTWLYNVEVYTANHAVIIGRVRPKDWPNFNSPPPKNYPNPINLPIVKYETKDGGKTFKKI